MIDSEIKRIVEDAYQEALRILRDNIETLHKIADALILHEKITGEEMRKLFPVGKLTKNPNEGLMVKKREPDTIQTIEESAELTDNLESTEPPAKQKSDDGQTSWKARDF